MLSWFSGFLFLFCWINSVLFGWSSLPLVLCLSLPSVLPVRLILFVSRCTLLPDSTLASFLLFMFYINTTSPIEIATVLFIQIDVLLLLFFYLYLILRVVLCVPECLLLPVAVSHLVQATCLFHPFLGVLPPRSTICFLFITFAILSFDFIYSLFAFYRPSFLLLVFTVVSRSCLSAWIIHITPVPSCFWHLASIFLDSILPFFQLCSNSTVPRPTSTTSSTALY